MIKAAQLSVELAGRTVLAAVDLCVARREIVGIIGPPEAGKTTLLKTMAGLLKPSAGELRADGAVIDWSTDLLSWRQRIGMSFQNDALFDSLSVFDNIAFPLRRRKLPPAEIEPRVRARLAEVGLENECQKVPAEISGGMRKRVGIARAAVTDPEIGLFDEPVAGLDPLSGRRILDLIVAMTTRLGMATMIVTNDLGVLLPVCNRVIMLHAGRVVYSGEAAGLYRSPRPEVVQFATGADAGPL